MRSIVFVNRPPASRNATIANQTAKNFVLFILALLEMDLEFAAVYQQEDKQKMNAGIFSWIRLVVLANKSLRAKTERRM